MALSGLFQKKLMPIRAQGSGPGIHKLLLVMRLTAILFVLSLHVSANVRSQETITLHVTNASLESVLKEIGRQTGYQYAMQDQWKAVAKRINISVADAPLDEVLKMAFGGQPFTYEIVQKIIVVKGKQTASTVATPEEPRSDHPDVKGVVYSDKGEALAGATVAIKELKISGQTNQKGEFELKNIPNGKYHMEISFIGYENLVNEIVVSDHMVKIVVRLRSATNTLDQTVVKGYYNTTQRLNTGDVGTIKGEDIEKQPVSDPILAMIGRVPGLNIQQSSGVPGAYATVRIRGQNSMFNGNDPLYIIDGVPYGSTSLTSQTIGGGVLGNPFAPGSGMSPFNSLNPADIERIDVLKDADATAIYGSRGANGVILITTKKGKAGSKFDVNVYTGYGKITRELPLLNTKQYLAMRHEAFNNDGTTPAPYDYDVNGVWDTTRYTDWQKVFVGNNSPITNAQVSFSGGSANTQFLINGGYTKQGTVYPGSYSDQKGSMHFNINHASDDQRFRLLFSAGYVYDKSNLPQFNLATYLAPDAPALYDANGNLNWQIEDGAASWTNPLSGTLLHSNAATTNLLSSLNLSYQILSGLLLKANLGYNTVGMTQTILTPSSSYPPPENQDPVTRRNLSATNNNKSWIIEPQLEYRRKILLGQLDVLAGTTFQENDATLSSLSARGFSSDALIGDPLAASNVSLTGNQYSLYHYNAVFGRISYNWDGKYLLNITARRDGSSRFGPGKQFGNFGAIGAGWIFTQEDFIKNGLSFLSFGKLRASYGVTGSDQIGNYGFLSTYVPNGFNYQNVAGLYPTQLTNPYLGWEQVKKEEGAIDLGMLHDRLLVSVGYYANRTENQLVNIPVPYITGFVSVEGNLPADIQNTGVEITVNSINIKTKNFSWTSTINLTVPKNKLISFPNLDSSTFGTVYKVGASLFGQYVYHFTDVNPQTGLYNFATKNPNGQPSYPGDLVFSKPITQSYYGSFLNTFNYKGFQLDFIFQFVKQLTTSALSSFSMPGSLNQNQPTSVLGRWQKSGDQSTIQRFSAGVADPFVAYNYLSVSDAVFTNGSFVRLKNVAFSYQLPVNWQKKAHMQNARIYVQCQNLLTITKYRGLDPENGSSGLPPLRMMTAGIQLAF